MSEERRFPEQPAVTPALYALVCVVLTERWCLSEGAVPLAAWVLVAVMALPWAICKLCKSFPSEEVASLWKTVACCACAVFAAALVSWAALTAGNLFVRAMGSSSVSAWQFEVLTDPRETRYGLRCRARASCAGKPAADVWLNLSAQLEMGDVVCGVGRFHANAEGARGSNNRMQGVWGSISLVRILRWGRTSSPRNVVLSIRERARTTLDPLRSDERAILAGCVLGDRRSMDERSLDRLFASCGVAHLVAVSGSHIALVSALVSKAITRLRLRPLERIVVLSVSTGLFVLVCGAPASAVRAWLMSIIASAGELAGRRVDPLSSVSLVALMMALVEPAVSGQLGYLLSVSCVISLVLFARYFAYVIDLVLPSIRLPKGTSVELRIKLKSVRADCVSSLAASIVAQVSTFPLTGPLFHRLSLVAPLSTLLVMPSLSVSMAFGLLGVVMGPIQPVSSLLLVCSDLATRWSLFLLQTLVRLPMASIPVSVDGMLCTILLLSLGFALLIEWPKPSRRSVAAVASVALSMIIVVIFRWRLWSPARITVLDIGQGDAILIQDGSAAILVDTGPDESIVEALARNYVLHLDAVVLTHLHDDHYGGLSSLVGVIGCNDVLVAKGVSQHLPDELSWAVTELTHHRCEELSYGDLLHVGSFELRVVWPHGRVTGEENADSLELYVIYRQGGRSLCGLLTGDAEQEETGAVIKAGDVGDIDFLKVGHHGSDISLSTDEAQVLLPEVAVASAGEGNSYGHPSKTCVDMLEVVGTTFLCTKDVGDVEVRPGREGPIIRCHPSLR